LSDRALGPTFETRKETDMKETEFPGMGKVRQKFEALSLDNVTRELKEGIARSGLKERLKANDEVAVTAGSRGIANIAQITATIVEELKKLGTRPFIVPAMGSHGGARAEGQIEVLASYGITEDSVGAPVRSSMEVVKVGEIKNHVPVFMDKMSLGSDAIVVVNRIKPHTSFRGPFESGLMKMLAIGLGKHKGASLVHSFGSKGLREMVPEAARVMMREANFVLGVGIVENAYDETARIVVLDPEEFEKEEPHLLEEARDLMPHLPFDDTDILIVDEIGKNISGTGMDTNIIGRLLIRGEKEFKKPEINKIIVLDVTPSSHGNAIGVGLADIITRRLANKIDYHAMYTNVLTSGFLNRAFVPLTCETDKEAIATAIGTFKGKDPDRVRVMRIKNTLQIEKLYISESLLQEARTRDDIQILGEMKPMKFDTQGHLVGGDYA